MRFDICTAPDYSGAVYFEIQEGLAVPFFRLDTEVITDTFQSHV